ncbi:MAG: aldehyde dehydrogenase [Oscillospiraceae bacterium]
METIEALVARQRAFFETGGTKGLQTRRDALLLLDGALRRREADIGAALQADLGKCGGESYMTELGLVLEELSYQRRHLDEFARPRRVKTPLAQFPSHSFVSPEPYGVTLVMSPWNYPLLLSLEPLISAVAAGNTVVLKPSADSPRTAALLGELIAQVFRPEYVAVVTGGRAENTTLLQQRFDLIFFTGGGEVGRTVLTSAARYLTPVILELGGKSPCIVDETADLRVAAARIVFGKCVNAGQTCVAPDYLLVQESVREPLVAELRRCLAAFYGEQPLQNPNWGRIVNAKHFHRLLGLLDGATVLYGGKSNEETLQIEPTLLGDVTADSPVMQQEIFGPLLPILTYETAKEAADFVLAREKPLALYLFTKSRAAEDYFLGRCSFGGGCVNDTLVQLASSELPFGGVGGSGMGAYHGRTGFEAFTHLRGIVRKGNWLDLPMRYPPYTKGKERLLHLFLGRR